MNRARWAAAALGLVAMAGVTAIGHVGEARANGVPQLVKLTYLAGVSNWGPKDAEGVLEFSFAEAYARVDVKNLPAQPGMTYEGWLTGGAGAPFLVGPITVDASGVGAYEAKLNGLSRYDYNTFVVAARSASAPVDVIPQDKSIAGRFTVISDNGTATAGDVSAGRPTSLPDTGQKAPDSLRQRAGRTFAVVLVAAGVAVFGLRLIRRGRSA